jgi:hypothetical protein
LASSIQVKATPANNRFKDALALESETLADISIGGMEELIPPSSVGHLIPSTGHRHGHRDALADSVSPGLDLVGGTPARPSSQASFIRRMAHDEPAILPSSPLMSRNTIMGEESPGPRRAVSWMGVQPPPRQSVEVLATPIKKSISRLDLMQSPVPPHERNQQSKVSIYEKLGWNYDFDDI